MHAHRPPRGQLSLAAPALAVTALVATSAPAAAAADPAPADRRRRPGSRASSTDGLILTRTSTTSVRFDDYGLTIDAALALDAVGAPDATSTAISDAIAAHIDDYIALGFGTDGVYAGATAKAAVLAQAAGDDADVVRRRQPGRRAREPRRHGRRDRRPDPGRLTSARSLPTTPTCIGQAFAAAALDAAGSDQADAVDRLPARPAVRGGLLPARLRRRRTPPTRAATAAPAAPDIDATALAVLTLQSPARRHRRRGARRRGRRLAASAQKPNGSLRRPTPTSPAANANSTGLAGWALLVAGETAAAAKAAGLAARPPGRPTSRLRLLRRGRRRRGRLRRRRAARPRRAGAIDAEPATSASGRPRRPLPALRRRSGRHRRRRTRCSPPSYVKAGEARTRRRHRRRAGRGAVRHARRAVACSGTPTPTGEADLQGRWSRRKAGDQHRRRSPTPAAPSTTAEINVLGARRSSSVDAEDSKVARGKKQVVTRHRPGPGRDGRRSRGSAAGKVDARGQANAQGRLHGDAQGRRARPGHGARSRSTGAVRQPQRQRRPSRVTR